MSSVNSTKKVAKHFDVSSSMVREWKENECPELQSPPYDLDAISMWLRSRERGQFGHRWKYIFAACAVIPVLITSIVGLIGIIDWARAFDGPKVEFEARYNSTSIPPDFIRDIDRIREETTSFSRFREFVSKRDEESSDEPSLTFLDASSEEEGKRTKALLEQLRASETTGENSWRLPDTIDDEDARRLIAFAMKSDRETLKPMIEKAIEEGLSKRSDSIHKGFVQSAWLEFYSFNYTGRNHHLNLTLRNTGDRPMTGTRLNLEGSGVATIKRTGKAKKVVPFDEMVELDEVLVDEELEIETWTDARSGYRPKAAVISYAEGKITIEPPRRVTGVLATIADGWSFIVLVFVMVTSVVLVMGAVFGVGKLVDTLRQDPSTNAAG